MTLETRSDVRFLSELYARDVPNAVLLAEYPSSNSDQTRFQNRTKFIIHDPYPPPGRELLKILGPHHLMCGWGRDVNVCSEVPPPGALIEHWQHVFGPHGCPSWQAFDPDARYVTLFPHESIPADHQVLEPGTNYALHSKEVIERIDCPQARVLTSIEPPCIVKLSHGYAGLGNFFIRESADEAEMREQLNSHWPAATLVVNSLIEDITGDFGVQFYLARDGSMVWLGVTQQHFNSNMRWCGGTFSAALQDRLFDDVSGVVEPVGRYLHHAGYFGLVGIDVLRDNSSRHFLVDVNPRLTGISPFLMASRIFARQGLSEGIYQASARFKGTMNELISVAEGTTEARVVVLSAFEEPGSASTVCHVSASSNSQQHCYEILNRIAEP